MGLQHGSENENDEDIDDSGSGGADYERNTCKSAFNDFLSIVATFTIITVYLFLQLNLTHLVQPPPRP